MDETYSAQRQDQMKNVGYGSLFAGALSQAQEMTLANVLNLYSAIGEHSLALLSNVHTKTVELKRHQKLLFANESAPGLFMVKKGWVSICQSVKSHGQDIYNVFMPGDIVGLRESFFDNRDIAVLALQNCVLERVSTAEVHALFEKRDDIRKAIISYVMVNDNIAIARLRSCTHHKAEERVAHYLLEVYARYRFKKTLDSNSFMLPITQEVIGELLGMTSVHVSRCMTALEQKKLIRKSRTMIKLLDPAHLMACTGFDEQLIYGHIYFKQDKPWPV